MRNLSTAEWKKEIQQEDAVIIDVRTPEEYNNGYIPQSKLINIQNPSGFTEAIEALDKTKPYYIYCRSGKRSMLACQVMENLGFSEVANLNGGILDWDGEIKQP